MVLEWFLIRKCLFVSEPMHVPPIEAVSSWWLEIEYILVNDFLKA